ncbi:MAG: hypothetical protein QME82_07795 [Bacillota bacterium]|nr:hypothetical protein [Bacillota bacterium]
MAVRRAARAAGVWVVLVVYIRRQNVGQHVETRQNTPKRSETRQDAAGHGARTRPNPVEDGRREGWAAHGQRKHDTGEIGRRR